MKIVGYLVKNCQQIYNSYSYNLLKRALSVNEKKLFSGIQNAVPEHELSRRIYGETKDSNTSYSRLKGSLRNKMMDMELINVEGNSIQKKRKKIYKLQLVAESLDNAGLRAVMILVAESCLKQAEKFRMYDVAANMTWKLAVHYKQYAHNAKLAIKNKDKWERYKTLHTGEQQAEWKLAEAINLCRHGSKENLELADHIKSMHEGIILNDNSYKLHYFTHLLRAIEADLRGDLQSKINALKDGLHYFENLYFRHNKALAIYRRNLINTYNQIGDSVSIAMAENLIKFELQEDDKTDHQKLELTHELATVKAKLNDYTKALEILASINIKNASNQIKKERILIDRLYLHILTEDRKVNFQTVNRRCRLAKEDPSGMGLALLIAEGMCHMLHGQIYKFEDKAPKIEKYIAEHLDPIKQAKHINLLRKLTGFGEMLDESKADDLAWIGSVDQLTAVIRRRELFI